jgi:hypothetical protein
MDDPMLFKLIGVCLFLIFLLTLAYYIAKKGKTGITYFDKKKPQRIQILETQNIDSKRQLHLIHIENTPYIVLTGAVSELIIRHTPADETPPQTPSMPDFNIPNFGNIIPGEQR